MTQNKKGRYVYCADCGCRLEKDGICKICGHIDVPLLPGIVPVLTGLTEETATTLLTGPEAQLTVGNITTENHETIATDLVIRSEPAAAQQLEINSAVDLILSLGPNV